MAYQPHPSVTQGGQVKSVTTDETAQQILKFLLAELQKMNIQLALMNDNIIDEGESLKD